MQDDISICLVPKKSQEQALQKIINQLADKYGAFPFIPHITIYNTGVKVKLNAIINTIKEVTVKIKPFTIPVEKINYSDVFIKTLYLQCLINKELNYLYQGLKNKFIFAQNYILHPHLSLIYKINLPEKEKKNIIKHLTYPQMLAIDKIIVITGPDIHQEKDVLNWKIEYQKNF